VFYTLNKHIFMQNAKNPLIFVVEDNPMYNKTVVSYLKTNKFTNVESYLSGEEALNNMQKKPDIVIQDYLLPGITGLEVLLKAKKMNPRTEFIFLSGQESIEVAVNCIKSGAYDYIVKDQAALQKMVNRINKINSASDIVKKNKGFKKGVILLSISLALIVIVTILLAIFQPGIFKR
jgi:DNA-binding NtrC family response regulator